MIKIKSTDPRNPTHVIIGRPLMIEVVDPDVSDSSTVTITLQSNRILAADMETLTLKSSKPANLILETSQVSFCDILVSLSHQVRRVWVILTVQLQNIVLGFSV
jgi:hypothetical protein